MRLYRIRDVVVGRCGIGRARLRLYAAHHRDVAAARDFEHAKRTQHVEQAGDLVAGAGDSRISESGATSMTRARKTSASFITCVRASASAATLTITSSRRTAAARVTSSTR